MKHPYELQTSAYSHFVCLINAQMAAEIESLLATKSGTIACESCIHRPIAHYLCLGFEWHSLGLTLLGHLARQSWFLASISDSLRQKNRCPSKFTSFRKGQPQHAPITSYHRKPCLNSYELSAYHLENWRKLSVYSSTGLCSNRGK